MLICFVLKHTINAYEESGQIVVDISCYKNPNMLYCMNLEALQVSSILWFYKNNGDIETQEWKKDSLMF